MCLPGCLNLTPEVRNTGNRAEMRSQQIHGGHTCGPSLLYGFGCRTPSESAAPRGHWRCWGNQVRYIALDFLLLCDLCSYRPVVAVHYQNPTKTNLWQSRPAACPSLRWLFCMAIPASSTVGPNGYSLAKTETNTCPFFRPTVHRPLQARFHMSLLGPSGT